MSVKTGNPLLLYSGIAALALQVLLPSAAYSQNRPAPAPSQIWADPGALEKAKKETATPDANKLTAPTPAQPASATAANERLSAPSAHKPTKITETPSVSGGERLNSPVHGSAEHKSFHQTKHRTTEARHANVSEPALASEVVHQFPAARGHVHNAVRTLPHRADGSLHQTTRAKAQQVVNKGLTDKNVTPPPEMAVGEYDPIYGYSNSNGNSNTISVAY